MKPVAAWTVDLTGHHEDYRRLRLADVGYRQVLPRYDFNDAFGVRGTYQQRLPRTHAAGGSTTPRPWSRPTSTTLQIAPNSPPGGGAAGPGAQAGEGPEPVLRLRVQDRQFLATVDAFQIKVRDRIVSTNNQRGWYGNGGYQGTGTGYTAADCLAYGNGFTTTGAAQGNNFGSCDMDVMNLVSSLITIDPNALRSNSGTVAMALSTNGIDTTTRGIDVVLSIAASSTSAPSIGRSAAPNTRMR